MKPCKHGHTKGRMNDGRCRECQRLRNMKAYHATPTAVRTARNAAWYATNKDKLRAYRDTNKERDKTVRRASYAEFRARELIKSAAHRAKKAGLPFDLGGHVAHYQSIIDTGLCQATGLLFDLQTTGSHSRRNPFAPSLDRINPSLGYLRGNVRVVLWAFNIALADWGGEVYAKIAKAHLKLHPWI